MKPPAGRRRRLTGFIAWGGAGSIALLAALAALPVRNAAALTEDESNTISVFQRISPSVVFITSSQLRRSLFSLNVYEIPRGSGSGFIWNSAGMIVTNYHVVANAERLMVTLSSGDTVQARIIGSAPDKDLAVISIDALERDLQPVPLGDSSKLEVGRKVLAIGNPFGLDTTLTQGIVSALGREIKARSGRTIRDVVQTDAAINPGNSGGPLLDSNGRLVGVNTAIYSPSGTNTGIGFAIPVNTVRRVVPQLIQHGRIQRPTLGIEIAPDQWQRYLRLPGVVVTRVYPGMPAERAGIIAWHYDHAGRRVPGDIILAIDGRPTPNGDDLLDDLERRQPGDTVTVATQRDGKQRRFKVTLAAPSNR